jgi:hypothetical protein
MSLVRHFLYTVTDSRRLEVLLESGFHTRPASPVEGRELKPSPLAGEGEIEPCHKLETYDPAYVRPNLQNAVIRRHAENKSGRSLCDHPDNM